MEKKRIGVSERNDTRSTNTASRRSVLRSAGIGLAGAGLFSGTSSALQADPASFSENSAERLQTAEKRDYTSPIRYDSIPDGYYRGFSTIAMARERQDTQALENLPATNFPDGLRMAIINVKRDSNGRPHYRYFTRPWKYSNSTWRETWSSSKFMAMASAAARIRNESDGEVGFDATIPNGDHVGQHVTNVVTSNNIGTGYNNSGNRLAGWFMEIAGREWTTELVQEWIGDGQSTLGANYGARPSGYGKTFTNPYTGQREYVDNSDQSAPVANRVTPIAAAEFLKRLVMLREDQATRMPGRRASTAANKYWEDLKILFYGAPFETDGGMSRVTDPLLENAGNYLDDVEMTNWRSFAKTGSGYSGVRNRMEFRYNGYCCFPNTAPGKQPIEFVVSAYHADLHGTKSRSDLANDVASQIINVMDGMLKGQLDEVASTPDTGRLHDLDGHWAEFEIRQLVQNDVVSGYSDGTIRPDRTVTRAEYAALLDSAFDLSGDETVPNFSDVPEDYWAREAIEEAAAAGFLSGYADGSFRPGQPIRKVEAIVSLSNGLDYPESSTSESALETLPNDGSGISLAVVPLHDDEAPLGTLFDDSDEIPGWAEQSVENALAGDLVDEHPFPTGNRLEPLANATRAEVFHYIYNHRN